MNRRNFFKLLGTVCGAVVVCPTELLRAEQPVYRIEKFCDFGVFPPASEQELIHEFREAFKNAKFKSPVPKGTKIIMVYDKFANVQFVKFHYKNDKKINSQTDT